MRTEVSRTQPQGPAMPNSEIDKIRADLAARPRPADIAERRARLDALGSHYEIPGDVRVEPVSANGVAAEWSAAPGADPARAACATC